MGEDAPVSQAGEDAGAPGAMRLPKKAANSADTPKAKEDTDKLFDAPEEKLSPKSPQDEPVRPELGAGASFTPALPPAPAGAMRHWTDNTGNYHVAARLVVILDGKVRLQKETGRFTTVPFERLSQEDLEFVSQQMRVASERSLHASAR